MTMRTDKQRNAAYRRDVLWSAAFIHRISGVALAVFLPFHFLVLGLALRSEAALDGFLGWTKMPLVKAAEAGLVFCLAVHLIGGLRILMLETHGWRPGQRAFAIWSVITAAFTGAAFLILA
ncbi:MAG: succinate dehydrogenase, cytochrome b556 subunit [Beijerinckiaceae bacterium]